MLVTILMLGLALACAAIGVWALRRPSPIHDDLARQPMLPPSSPPAPASPPSPASQRQLPTGIPQPAPEIRSRPGPDAVPSRPAPAAIVPPATPRAVAAAVTTATTAVPDASLAFLDFDGTLGRIHIERPEVVIGRHTQDDIRINDVRVSRHHARLVAKRDGGFEIHNLTSVRSEPNPMQINGETREHADIVDGDVVTLGGVSFVFRQAA